MPLLSIPRLAFVPAAILLWIFTIEETVGQAGLSARQPISGYLNGNLPSNIADTRYSVSDVYPALRFKDPIRVISQPGLTNRQWVLCQDGEIWIFDKTNPASKSLLLDIKDRCVGHNEGEGDSGLLGIAFHPQFGQAGSLNRGHVYLWYSFRPPGEGWGYYSYNRLSRFTLADGASTLSPSSELVLINQYDRKTWHNGGGMFFGADAFLYIANGDEGDDVHGFTGGGVYSNSQKIDDGLFGGILRIDVDMNPTRSHAIRRQPLSSAPPPAGWPASYSQNYFIPNDNPWLSTTGAYLEEFFAIGLRSPHSLTRDAVTGAAIVSETGQDEQEEINVLAKSANYQWPFLEGKVVGPKLTPVGPGASTPPIHINANRTVDGSGMVGGWVYRGSQFSADLGGQYVFADFISNKVWALDWQTPGAPRRWLATIPRIPGSTAGITGLSIDADQEIYATVHGDEGRIYKLISTSATVTPPATLSATQAFSNLSTLTTAPGIVPLSVNSALWSDGSEKLRWIAVPNDGAPYTAAETVGFAPTGEWSFPVGTVTIKHFELPISEINPALKRRLETRFIVRTQSGWYGLTYRWRADGSEADLVPSGGADAEITITQSNGSTRVQTWNFPSRENCMGCHNSTAGFALGVNTRQLNGNHTYSPTGITANQIATWSSIGLFSNAPTADQISGFAKMTPIHNASASLEHRMRSYLDANCSHCHHPGGVLRSTWDARFDTPLALQGIVNGIPEGGFGIAGSRVILPGDKDKSLLYIRMNDIWNPQVQMPPLARNIRHDAAISVLTQWITQLASPSTNQPPVLVQPSNQSTVGGSGVSLQLSASDPDGASLTFSASGLPDGLSIDSSTGLISGSVSVSALASYSVNIGVTDGILSDSKSFTWATTAPLIPAGSFAGQDIGAVFAAGSNSFTSAGSIYTIRSYGSQIHGTADDFRFSHQVLTGDGEIVARVTSQSNSNEWADAGLMIRESLAVGSRHAYIGVTPAHGFASKHRSLNAGSLTYDEGPELNLVPNNWLRLVRSGNGVSLFTSANGTTWALANSVTFTSLPQSLYIGLAVCSVTWDVQATVTFDNVRTVGLVTNTAYHAWATGSGISGGNFALAANPAKDGVSNLIKYAFNLNPALPDLRVLSTGSFGLPTTSSSGGGVLRIEFIRRIGSGLVYAPEKSTNLSLWVPITSPAVISPIDSNWERVVHHEPWDRLVTPQIFSRLSVTLP